VGIYKRVGEKELTVQKFNDVLKQVIQEDILPIQLREYRSILDPKWGFGGPLSYYNKGYMEKSPLPQSNQLKRYVYRIKKNVVEFAQNQLNHLVDK
jgi:hypothetical protein